MHKKNNNHNLKNLNNQTQKNKYQSLQNNKPQIKNKINTPKTSTFSQINAKINNLREYINKPVIKYGLITLASIYLIKNIGENVASKYANSQFKQRWEQTQSIAPENTYNLEQSLGEFTVYQKFEILKTIKSMESKVEDKNNIESLLKYIDTHQGEIIKLTSTEYETNGFVLKGEKEISIAPMTSIGQEITHYITEIKSNDFTNKDLFVDFLLTNYTIAFETEPSPIEKKAIKLMFDILKSQNTTSFTPNFNNTNNKPVPSSRILAVTNDQGEIIKQYTPEEISTITQNATSLLNDLQRRLQYLSIWQLQHFLERDNALSRYHTHPKNDLNYMPSKNDLSNTLFFGPNVLFSQTNDTLRAYLIQKNKSTKIYEHRIDINIK
jgi:hypothetical protein